MSSSALLDLIRNFLTWPGTETLIKLGGLIGVLIAAYFAFKRASAVEKQTFVLQEQLAIAKRSEWTDHFNSAVVQLAESRVEIRIGGLYTLKRLGASSEPLRASVQEIFAAYIRSNYEPSYRKGQQLFPISFLSDFFGSTYSVPLPKSYKSTADLSRQIHKTLESAGIVDADGVIVDKIDPFETVPVDPCLIVPNNEVLSPGLDATQAIAFLLKYPFHRVDNLRQDVRVAITASAQLPGSESSPIDFSQVRLNHAVLTEMLFNFFNFDSANLFASDVSFTRFVGCSLRSVDIRGCHMHCSSFIESVLTKACFDFSKSWAGGRKDYKDKGMNLLDDSCTVGFKGSTLEFTTFRYAILHNSDFRATRHYNSIFYCSSLEGANFSCAVLKHSQFSSAWAYGCNFSGADISGCSFDGAKLRGSSFQGCRIEPDENHEKVGRREFPVSFRGADLHSVTFDNSDLHDGDFRESQNLTLEQLAVAKSLKGARFDTDLQALVESNLAHLVGDLAGRG